jgi:4'-phosphopantetheinyl transferase
MRHKKPAKKGHPMCEATVIVIERDLSPQEYQTLLRFVSPEKRERIERFSHVADARRTLLGDALIRMLTREKLGLENHQLSFSHNDCGKPFLVGYDRFHFSLSHAGNYVACATDEQPVGIDIEEMRQMDLKIAKRFYSEDEKRFLFSMPEDKQQKTFYQIWTKKESYIKRDGRGLRIPLPSFSVLSAADVSFHQVFENEKAVCMVCTAKEKRLPTCKTVSVEDIVQIIRKESHCLC